MSRTTHLADLLTVTVQAAIDWFSLPADASETFTTFADDSHGGSTGLATLIAIVGPVTTYLGADSAVQ